MKEPVTVETEDKYKWESILIKLYGMDRSFVDEVWLLAPSENNLHQSLITILWQLNDTFNLTFEQTADWLEATFL